MGSKLQCTVLAALVAMGLATGCSDSSDESTEIGNSGVTEDELEEAAALSEARGDDGRPTAERDGVLIRANTCEVTDGTVLSGTRRRVWVAVDNSQPNPIEVTVAINFDDGKTIEGSGEVQAAVGEEPAGTVLAWNEEVESDASRNGETCIDEVESVELVEVSGA